jgi:hypothetical protein
MIVTTPGDRDPRPRTRDDDVIDFRIAAGLEHVERHLRALAIRPEV